MRSKFRHSALLLPASLAAALLAAPAPAEHHAGGHGGKLSATLNGANEVDAQGIGNKGDADGSGSFSGKLDKAKGRLCYTLTSAGIDAPTMAHIHTGAAGVNGGVYVALPELSAGEHCIPVEQDKIEALSTKPGEYYVNVHNATYPAGAVRGQLSAK